MYVLDARLSFEVEMDVCMMEEWVYMMEEWVCT